MAKEKTENISEKEIQTENVAETTAQKEVENSKERKQTPEHFTFEGSTYRFAADAPKLIRIEGSVKTQEEILEDEDLLLQLVAGGSSLIEKVV